MEASLPDLNFLDSTTPTSNANPADVKVTEENCPVCWQNNKIRKVIPVYYKMREAIYTCEDTNCLYFIADDFGNLQKFTKTHGSLNYNGNVTIPTSVFNHSNEHNSPNRTSQLQSEPMRSNEIVDSSAYLEDLFNSGPPNDEVKSLMDELSDLFETNQSEKLGN